MFQSLLDALLRIDYAVWTRINVDWQNPLFDFIAPYLRNQYFWTPLYVFLAIFMPLKFGKQGWIWCAVFLITFGLSDYISASLIKPYVHRIRPCNDPALHDVIHLIVYCGSGYSFPSSHAANHFSLAVFMSLTLGKFGRWIWPLALFWAFSIAYSQVYVGVHYPLDVTCGGILGICIGTITGTVINKKSPVVLRKKQSLDYNR